jgi:dihydropteroate synthase
MEAPAAASLPPTAPETFISHVAAFQPSRPSQLRPEPLLLRCKDRTVDLTRPVVMGVLNVTPDSFSDGGRFLDADAAVRHGVRLAEEGAAFIDVGGESTRPGAAPVGVEEELRRVIPVIERLRAATSAVISIDTSKPELMRAAAAAGAGLVNDVRALRAPGALEAALASGCAVCLMHMQGEPRTMQAAPAYHDVVGEVRAFLAERARVCGRRASPPTVWCSIRDSASARHWSTISACCGISRS